MPKKPKESVEEAAYRHETPKRLNNPEAGNIDRVPKAKETKKTYNWDPREAPQLVWSGKAGLKMAEVKEEMSFEVPLVNLHIHERVAPEAILRAARREDAQRSLFADPAMDFSQEVQFYQHEVDWSNRLILGDSLQVMSSLLEREGMRGKVQMIYLDPPYGIKFGSNFQPRIDKRDVKDGADADLTREVEQVQAFRDTWELGVHSYLSYLRDRLILARELLADSGSVFVQIGDENVHRVRLLMDEVFGDENYLASIVITKTSSATADTLASVYDTLLWFSKDANQVKYNEIFEGKSSPLTDTDSKYDQIELEHGERVSLGSVPTEYAFANLHRVFRLSGADSQTGSENTRFRFDFNGRKFEPSGTRGWSTNLLGMNRLKAAERLFASKNILNYVRFFADHPATSTTNVWAGIGSSVQSRSDPKVYVVQTGTAPIQRCVLMTTDPGDLVLDPTCGSGTTAYVAEQWGRRWITCDTSRVAVAIARHRLMTAAFDYYKLRHLTAGVSGGFRYKTVPHITLKSIAQNAEIDAIAAEFQPKFDAALAELNSVFGKDWKEWEVPKLEKEHGEEQ